MAVNYAGRWNWISTRLPEVYLLAAMLLVALSAYVTPPFLASDETAHAERAIQVSQGVYLPRLISGLPVAPMDSGFLKAETPINDVIYRMLRQYPISFHRPVPRVSPGLIAGLSSTTWSGETELTGFRFTEVYPPTLYLPQSIAWRLMRARADATIFQSLQVARLCNGLCAILLGWLAVRLCPRLRWAIALFLLTPTVIALQGSCSQDALIFPLCALACGLPLVAILEGRTLRKWEWVLSVSCFLLLSVTRPPYLVLALLLVVMAVRVKSRAAIFAAFGSISLVVLGIAMWWHQVTPFGVPSAAEANPQLQEHFLLTRPHVAAVFLMEGFAKKAPGLLLGWPATSGWGDVRPGMISLLLIGLLIVVALIYSVDTTSIHTRTRLATLAIAFGVILTIGLAEYVAWTPPFAHTVLGMSPRYFLPLLLLVPLLFPVPVSRPRSAYLPYALAVLVAVNIAVSRAAAHTFYGLGLWAALHLH